MISSDTASQRTYDSDRRPHPFIEEVLELFRYRHLVWLWSKRNLTLRYKRSVLGVVWTLLEPLMLMTMLTIVFSAIFRFQVKNYPIYVLVAFTMWDFFRRTTLGMIEEVSASQNLSTRVYLPQSTFAVASVITFLVNWALALGPLLAIILVLRHPLSPAIALLPAVMLLIVMFTLGVGLLVATVAIFFPDFGLMFSVALTGIMYATPIIYPLEVVPEKYRWVILANPLTHLLGLLRAVVFEARYPSSQEWLISAALATTSLALGWWVFTRYRDSFNYAH